TTTDRVSWGSADFPRSHAALVLVEAVCPLRQLLDGDPPWRAKDELELTLLGVAALAHHLAIGVAQQLAISPRRRLHLGDGQPQDLHRPNHLPLQLPHD